MSRRLDLETGKSLLNFRAGAASGVVSEVVADEQLKGAVAIHNLLQEQRVAYLADEVGMGKTYVAMGAIALLRHFQPRFRVLVVAPKENIQRKWIKEWRNFVSHVVRVEDLRVKGLGGYPARADVKVDRLIDLVTETSRDPDRDFFARLTSFSLPLGTEEGWRGQRKRLVEALPWLDQDLLNGRDKDTYKRNFARAVNCALPPFDLVVIDEAHNLKAGWSDGRSSIRNAVMALGLGGRAVGPEEERPFRGYGPRAKRVLFLSATPIDTDIRQLWNQLDLLGFSSGWSELKDPSLSPDQHRDVVRRLLVRRTAGLRAGDNVLTKSEYRREWRRGGITEHDQPLQIASDRQRLAVALIQKKVSEVLGGGHHGHSFQVGLLASFESFLETVESTRRQDSTPNVDRGEQDDAEDNGPFHRPHEERAASLNDRRVGPDIAAINRISRDHLNSFGAELPHPKMDSLVDRLAQAFQSGRKALVFVRRVASVDELQRKIEERYDAQLFDRLRADFGRGRLRSELEQQIDAYLAIRKETRHDIRARAAGAEPGSSQKETSTVETFFGWFFRGAGPKGVRSGASLADQMDQEGGTYSTFLEENYVALTLGVAPEDTIGALRLHVGDLDAWLARVGLVASRYVGRQEKRLRRRRRMRAVQAAALELLREVPGDVGQRAAVVFEEVFRGQHTPIREEWAVPDVPEWLATRTLFSELRRRDPLAQVLWPVAPRNDFREEFRERELRRELMSTMMRKGHPIIDLFVLIAKRLDTLRQRTRETVDDDATSLADEFLDLLEAQGLRADTFSSFRELADAAAHFGLIAQLNMPEVGKAALGDVPRLIGKSLRSQKPVAGMAGKVNSEVVRQFRMPGYPLVLVTTDLLKEGEDLHTFCSDVYHYGIAWMPSELEQRVGRVDRVGSQAERRLSRGQHGDADLLQVYYPHLGDTVEVLQLRRVYGRLNRFLRMMHEGLGVPPKERPDVSIVDEGLWEDGDFEAIRAPLRSAFTVTAPMLTGARRPLEGMDRVAGIHERLDALVGVLTRRGAKSLHRGTGGQITGEMALGERVQPFTLLLRSIHGRPVLRCVSPVGRIDAEAWDDDRAAQLGVHPLTRVALERNDRFESYDVAIEGDVLLGPPRADEPRAMLLVDAVLQTADRMEHALLGTDASLETVMAGIRQEAEVAR